MATLGEWINENYDDVKRLTKAGVLPPKIINNHNIYKTFTEEKSESKMQRYENTAAQQGLSSKTVARAVKDMERPI